MQRGLKFNKWRLILVALPLILLAIVTYQNAWRTKRLRGLGGEVVALAYSPDGKNIVCSTDDGQIGQMQIWQPEAKKWRSLRLVRNDPKAYGYAREDAITQLSFTKDGQTLYGGGAALDINAGNNLWRWDVATGQQQFICRRDFASILAVSPDKHWAAAADFLIIDLFDLTRADKIPSPKSSSPSNDGVFHQQEEWKRTDSTVCAMAFDPASKTLAVWDGKSDVLLFAVPSGALLRKFPCPDFGDGMGRAALQWSPNNRWLAAHDNNQLVLWQADGRLVKQLFLPKPLSLFGIGSKVPVLAWSPDSTQLATGGDSVCLWSTPNLKLQRQLRAQGGVAFSPDGCTLTTGGFEGAHEVLLWPLKVWPF